MKEKPQILEYGRAQGVSIRLSQDRTTFDAEIRPTPPGATGLSAPVLGAILAILPFCVLLFFAKGANRLAVIGFVGMIGIGAVAAISYFSMAADKREIRIHATRTHLSLDDRSGLQPSISRRWERDEIRDIRARHRAWNEGGGWTVQILLPLVEPELAVGLSELDAKSIVDGLKVALDLHAQGAAVIQQAPPALPTDAPAPTIDYASIPSRYGVVFDRSLHRVTIIVPAIKLLGLAMSNKPEAIIELDQQSLCIDCADHSRKDPSERLHRSWFRRDVGSIKGDLYGMGLTIRVSGKEMFEMLHRCPQELRVWIARTLTDELRRVWESPSHPDDPHIAGDRNTISSE